MYRFISPILFERNKKISHIYELEATVKQQTNN